jgi:hypothetical protein
MMNEYLASQTTTQQVGDACVVTLPFLTIDQRWVDVFVEPRFEDYFLVNDGGKAVNELILRGIKITNAIDRDLGIFAERFAVGYIDETFQTGTKIEGLAKAIASVGMCSSLAMTETLQYASQTQAETVERQMETVLKRWGKGRAKLTSNVTVDGELSEHNFSFLLSPPRKAPVSVSILNPTAGARSAAERFGFKTKDLAGTQFAKWKSVAVQAKAEVWSADARRIVEKCADAGISVNSTERPSYEEITDVLDHMVA